MLKLAIKNASTSVKHRILPPATLLAYTKKLASHLPQVQEILSMERSEKALSTAEKELDRAENLVNFRDEIMARPKREWFQSVKEKEADKESSRMKHLDDFGMGDRAKDERNLPGQPIKTKKRKQEVRLSRNS